VVRCKPGVRPAVILEKKGYIELPMKLRHSYTFSVKMPIPLDKKLNEISTQKNITKSDVIRNAIDSVILSNRNFNREIIEQKIKPLYTQPVKVISFRIEIPKAIQLRELASLYGLSISELIKYALSIYLGV